jgi:hypothetical protein
MAEPTMPLWPAIKIFFFIIHFKTLKLIQYREKTKKTETFQLIRLILKQKNQHCGKLKTTKFSANLSNLKKEL